jgi:hypothetical protein
LGVDNLDKLVMIYNNWPSDVWIDYNLIDGNKLAKFFVVEKNLLEENENLLEKARYFEKIEF